MYFGLSEEQVSLEETIKKYLKDNASLDVIREIASGNHEKAEIIHRELIGEVRVDCRDVHWKDGQRGTAHRTCQPASGRRGFYQRQYGQRASQHLPPAQCSGQAHFELSRFELTDNRIQVVERRQKADARARNGIGTS